MAIGNATTIMTTVFADTIIFNVTWLISLAITFLSLLILTRDANKWKILAFPVMLMWHIAGVPPNFLIYLVSAIVFAIEAMSLQTIGQIMQIATGTVKRTFGPSQVDKMFARRAEKATARKMAKGDLGALGLRTIKAEKPMRTFDISKFQAREARAAKDTLERLKKTKQQPTYYHTGVSRKLPKVPKSTRSPMIDERRRRLRGSIERARAVRGKGISDKMLHRLSPEGTIRAWEEELYGRRKKRRR